MVMEKGERKGGAREKQTQCESYREGRVSCVCVSGGGERERERRER